MAPIVAMQAEFGLPQWAFRMSTYAFVGQDRAVCSYLRDGASRLVLVSANDGILREIETPYTEVESLRPLPGGVVFYGASATEPLCVVRLELQTGECRAIGRARENMPADTYLSRPEAITYISEDGRDAHAFYYAPRNDAFTGPTDEKPPLIVISHGGPTGATTTLFSPGIQFWTSRGFAVVDVNYGGSTGYGREYRERLRNRWGIVDVDDCVSAARSLIDRGLVDPRRLIIRGASAGGYTTLAALAFRNLFKAGASHYGVCDLEALARDTHKFESRYLDSLIGPYPARRDLYIERSPIHATDGLSCPVIFLQGLEDKIVPPNQAQMMVEALASRGIPVAYVAFQGEQHGFRRAENIRRALDAELFFYSRVFGFELAEPLEPIPIENLAR